MRVRLSSCSCTGLEFFYVILTQVAKVSANAINVEGTDSREDFDESVAVFDSQQYGLLTASSSQH